MQPVRFVNIFRLHTESVKSDGPVTGQRMVLAISTKKRTIEHDVGTEISNYGNIRYSTYSITYVSVVECDKPLDMAAEVVKVVARMSWSASCVLECRTTSKLLTNNSRYSAFAWHQFRIS